MHWEFGVLRCYKHYLFISTLPFHQYFIPANSQADLIWPTIPKTRVSPTQQMPLIGIRTELSESNYHPSAYFAHPQARKGPLDSSLRLGLMSSFGLNRINFFTSSKKMVFKYVREVSYIILK